MTTGAYWNVDDPSKPWADFDSDADIKIPLGFNDWLAELGTTYDSHEIIAASPLECVDDGTYDGETALVRMRLLSGADFADGTKYPFTTRIHGADGTTQDDRTLYLKVKSR